MKSYRLTENELALWLRYIEHQVGFVLPNSQVNWVKGVIERHLMSAQMTSTALLATIGDNSERYHALFDDILIPRTQFFRHLPTFNFIRDYTQAWQQHHAKEIFIERAGQSVPQLTAWSVGCSTGQETVSMALTISAELNNSLSFQVYGSDFHQTALAQARSGSYDVAEWDYIPPRFYALLSLNENKKIQVPSKLMQHIHYFSKNLVQYMQPIPLEQKQCQIIVCKNVLIYFRQFEQRDIVDYLSQYLAEDGIMLLGSGELPQFTHSQLLRIPNAQINAFCRNDPPAWLQALFDKPVVGQK